MGPRKWALGFLILGFISAGLYWGFRQYAVPKHSEVFVAAMKMRQQRATAAQNWQRQNQRPEAFDKLRKGAKKAPVAKE
jgi:hypothetical protein